MEKKEERTGTSSNTGPCVILGALLHRFAPQHETEDMDSCWNCELFGLILFATILLNSAFFHSVLFLQKFWLAHPFEMILLTFTVKKREEEMDLLESFKQKLVKNCYSLILENSNSVSV